MKRENNSHAKFPEQKAPLPAGGEDKRKIAKIMNQINTVVSRVVKKNQEKESRRNREW